MRILAIIPARGGSKRIERKNIRPFAGAPIISYSINAALAAGCFEEVMVSTDDEEIAEVARRYGASVPFMRSAKTSDDYATTADVIAEVLGAYRALGREFDAICCIYATAPFVTPGRLRDAAGMLKSGEAQAAFTCVEYSYPTQRCLVVDAGGRVAMKFPEYARSRSQDLQKTYHDAGQFYFSTVRSLEACGSLWGPDTRPIILPELEVQDLDTPTDWKLAEMKFRLIGMPGTFRTSSYKFMPYPDMTDSESEFVLESRNEPAVREQMVNREEISRADHERFRASLRGRRDKQYYVVFDNDGNIIGSVNIERTGEDSMERGIWIAAGHRGKRHAVEMLRQLYNYLHDNYSTRFIETRVRIDNAASLALEKALGAVETGRDDEYAYFKKELS